MKAFSTVGLLLVVFALAKFTTVAQAVPGMINYQGKVEVDGEPFGAPRPQTGHFRFAIVEVASGTWANLYWSNDGNDPPTTNVDLTVDNGVYSVILGDATLPGMTPDSRRLRE